MTVELLVTVAASVTACPKTEAVGDAASIVVVVAKPDSRQRVSRCSTRHLRDCRAPRRAWRAFDRGVDFGNSKSYNILRYSSSGNPMSLDCGVLVQGVRAIPATIARGKGQDKW